MEWTTTSIALVSFLIGIFSNPIPILGSLAFNILSTSILLLYQQLAELVPFFPMLPTPIFVGIMAFSIGVFTIRFLAYTPIPYVQQFAQMLKGGN